MAWTSSQFTAVNLDALPQPDAVEQISFDDIRAAMLSDLAARDADLVDLPPSDPIVKVIDVAAYRETLMRQRANDAVRAVMLAYASGADLENLAAFYGVSRQTDESDADLRRRVQLAPEALSTAGSLGSYLYHALTVGESPISSTLEDVSATELRVTYRYDADAPGLRGLVQDAQVLPTTVLAGETQVALPGSVTVYVLQRGQTAGGEALPSEQYPVAEGEDAIYGLLSHGWANRRLIEKVAEHLSAETVRPLTDQVQVTAAQVIDVDVWATLTVYDGPGGLAAANWARQQVLALLAERYRIGDWIPHNALIAALFVEGVRQVEVVLHSHETVDGTRVVPGEMPRRDGYVQRGLLQYLRLVDGDGRFILALDAEGTQQGIDPEAGANSDGVASDGAASDGA